MKVEHKVYGPYLWTRAGDGDWWGYATPVIETTDVRQTPFGPVDFGCVQFLPSRLVRRPADTPTRD